MTTASTSSDETFQFGVDWLDQDDPDPNGPRAMPAHYDCTPVSPSTDCYVRTTGTITDNDPLPNVRVADAAASEGNDVVFTITMDAASSRSVVLRLHHPEQNTGTGRNATEGARAAP